MSNRLYVGNLSFQSTDDSLRAAFSRLGEVTDVPIITDRMTGQSRGFGFVTLTNAPDAQRAVETMNGASLDGRALRMNEAEERAARARGVGGGGCGSVGASGGEGGRRAQQWGGTRAPELW